MCRARLCQDWGFSDLSDHSAAATCELCVQLAGGFISGRGTHEIELFILPPNLDRLGWG